MTKVEITMEKPVHVLGFAGSLRAGSYNRAALRAAQELLPEGMTLTIFDLAPIPLYNADLDTAGAPESVRAFKELIAAADALLIVTPEYNGSIPSVLKNALDWASRPPSDAPLDGKPLAMMGATPGTMGTVRAQYHLRQVCAATNMHTLNRPEVFISQAAQKFDAEGQLIDGPTREWIAKLMSALGEWARVIGQY